jgi:SAM-dependent methyltransferase
MEEESARAAVIKQNLIMVGRFLRPSSRLLEVGSGDCGFAVEAAKRVRAVYAVDVSREIAGRRPLPANVSLLITDGSNISVPDGSVDVIFSSQLMEHLHPEDAVEQLGNIHRALAPGGVYLCVTPNALSGPHDVSRDFDDVPTGLHLKEYTVRELLILFRAAGFSRVRALAGARSFYREVPVSPLQVFERLLMKFPERPRKFLARFPVFRPLLGIKLIGFK